MVDTVISSPGIVPDKKRNVSMICSQDARLFFHCFPTSHLDIQPAPLAVICPVGVEILTFNVYWFHPRLIAANLASKIINVCKIHDL